METLILYSEKLLAASIRKLSGNLDIIWLLDVKFGPDHSAREKDKTGKHVLKRAFLLSASAGLLYA